MTFTLWQILTVLGGIIGSLVTVAKYLFSRSEKNIIEHINKLETLHSEQNKEIQRIEKDFLQFKAELPSNYVNRHDYIREFTVLDAKLDKVLLQQNHYITSQRVQRNG